MQGIQPNGILNIVHTQKNIINCTKICLRKSTSANLKSNTLWSSSDTSIQKFAGGSEQKSSNRHAE